MGKYRDVVAELKEPTKCLRTASPGVLMDGGPASVYAPRAWAAFHELADTNPVGVSR